MKEKHGYLYIFHSMKPKVFRLTTVPISLNILLKGQLNYLGNYFEVKAISGKGKDLETVQKREGIAVIPIEMQRQISPRQDLTALIRLYRLFRKEKPDIIHSITPKAGLLSMIAGKAAGVPIRMHTFTGLVFPYKTGMMQHLLIAMDRILCRCATHVYPEGNGVKNDLIKYKISNKPLRVMGNGNVNGIDTAYFSPKSISDTEKEQLRAKLGIANGNFIFIFVGRLVTDKGINELVRAFCEIQKTEDALERKVNLLLVGSFEPELDPLLPETVTAIQNNKDIVSVGYQEDVRPYFAISDCLVFPSYREGFPNVVMQAGAMQVASIVSNISGCNEIIQNGENGILVPKKNREALKMAMQNMRDEPQKMAKMQLKAREIIEKRFVQRALWTEIRNEYTKLLQTRKVQALGGHPK